MKICKKCILNDNIPSVKIGENGLCNYCVNEKKQRIRPENEDELMKVIAANSDKPYQVILAYSGGKDSSYTLKLLREKYKFQVLTVTFDNGFMSERCLKNIKTVTAVLGTDNIIIRYAYPEMCRLFNRASQSELFPVKAMERASTICISCISLVKSIMYREAIQRGIPIICFGWTPGQIGITNPLLKLDYQMILANERQIRDKILAMMGDGFSRFFLDPDWLAANKENIPYLYYPFVNNEYDEEHIIRSIQAIGWEMEEETDSNSTNCLLNTYANFVHQDRFGYHPYCMEMANMVRQGLIKRETALRKISNIGSIQNVRKISNILSQYN
ncbi:MAG: hypothetical protein GX115_06985 [Ruminiclostridium sp.]|nr:hypothetical protein [Ruminiclostridium sp.]